MKKITPLSITLLTGTLNPDLKIFEMMLKAVKNQTYKGKVNIVVMDGGTTNGGIALAKKYGCTVRVFKNDADEGSNRLYPCKKLLTGEIVIILQSDNIMPNRDFLAQIVEPFEDKEIFATYTMHNTYLKNMNMLTRYTALIGAPDPTLYYLGKSDKVPIFQNHYDKGKILKEEKNYYKVRFTKDTLPTVGDNGFAIRTDIFRKIIHPNEVFYHTDKYMNLLKQGIDTYGVIKNAIIHTTKPGIWQQVKRRIEVKKHFTDEMRGQRTYLVFNWKSHKDWIKLILYIIFTITLIQPIAFSIFGYSKRPDKAWFLHPIMCLLMVFGYGISEIGFYVKRFFIIRK